MADQELQTILNSGSLTNINLGGTATANKLLKSSEVDTKISNINFDDLANTPTLMTGQATSRVIVNDDETALIYEQTAYAGYASSPALVLTNVYQKLTSFVPLITPKNTTESSGTFTATISGVYEWHIERTYINEDNNPSQPVRVYFEVRRNGIAETDRDLIIPAATANDEPSIISFNTPYIVEVVAGDYFEFYFKAEEGTASPSSTQLTTIQLTADKIH